MRGMKRVREAKGVKRAKGFKGAERDARYDQGVNAAKP